MIKVQNVNILIFNFIFCFFPISFILGNQAINLNIFLLSIFTLLFFSKKIFNIKFNSLDRLLFFFFIYIYITLFLNYLESQIENKIFAKEIFYKSLFFLRYLILYIALRYLIFKKIINLKLFNITCAVVAIIVSFDVYIQFITGKNIFGTTPYSSRHYSSFFGEELIAGGYIQKFSLFVFFLPILLTKKFFFKTSLLFFLFLFFFFSIILTGNRMPLVLYFLSFFILVILNKKIRKYFFLLSFIVFIFLFIAFKNISIFKMNTLNFFNNGKFLITTIFDPNLKYKPIEVWKRPYVTEFQCGKEAIQLNPILGGGLRSYRENLSGCSSHPHNYYLEIISDLGIVGLFFILFFLYKLFIIIFNNYISEKPTARKYFNISIPPFLILLMEFFPFRSSGSFFTTNNATLIFIMLSILVSLYGNYKKK